MLDTKIITQTNGNGQQDKAQQFTAAFVPTSQTTQQPNMLEKALFVSQKVYFYKQELKRLQADLKKTEVLLRGHETWLSELVRQIESVQK